MSKFISNKLLAKGFAYFRTPDNTQSRSLERLKSTPIARNQSLMAACVSIPVQIQLRTEDGGQATTDRRRPHAAAAAARAAAAAAAQEWIVVVYHSRNDRSAFVALSPTPARSPFLLVTHIAQQCRDGGRRRRQQQQQRSPLDVPSFPTPRGE